MTRSTAYAYKVVVTTEEEHITIEFESTDELSKNEQEEKAAQILLAAIDDVETGVADMEVKRASAFAYKVVITTEDEHSISIEFESLDKLSRREQEKRVERILLAIKDDVEMGIADMEVKRASDVLIDTETDGASTQTIKTYIP